MDLFSIKIFTVLFFISSLFILVLLERLMWWRYTKVHFDKLSPVIFRRKWTIPTNEFEKWLHETIIPNRELETIIDREDNKIYFRQKKHYEWPLPSRQAFEFTGKISITEEAGDKVILLIYRIQPFNFILFAGIFLLAQILILSAMSELSSFLFDILPDVVLCGMVYGLFFTEKRIFHRLAKQIFPAA